MRNSHMWVKPCEGESKVLISGDFTPMITQTHEQLRDKRELCAGFRPGGPRCRTWLADNLHFGSVNTDPFKEFITACAIGQEVRLEPRLRPTDPLPLGTSTHIELRGVGGTFSVSFNGMVQCTTVFTGQVLPARTDYTMSRAPPVLRRMSWPPRVRVIQLAIGAVALC